MFQYYNAHPYQLDVDDCVKRAITVTMSMEYMDVQRGLNQHKKITGAKKFNTDGNPRSYVENVLGFPRVAIPKNTDGTRVTVCHSLHNSGKDRCILSEQRISCNAPRSCRSLFCRISARNYQHQSA